jgi:hypothetical protein
VSARTSVQVVTEAKSGWLTMPDLRVFVQCWDSILAFAEAAEDARPDAVEPVVVTEGQGGRLRKITASLPERVLRS